ncbi:MAG: DUF2093 domain-containing protein [Pseudomonadota bacterium]|nr:DUF2093 domain-containing protein [Pseudomonadota bacterium]
MVEKDAGPATLHYAHGEFAVLKAGRFVACAVTGRAIPLEVLRYWSVERQEAYAGPGEARQGLAPPP